MSDGEGAKCLEDSAELPYPRTEYDSVTKDIKFYPAVYEQRYLAVYNILNSEKWNGTIKKLIDFGCAELRFFTLIKALTKVEQVLMVDIDDNLLSRFGMRAEPFLYDYIHQRDHPFRVQVYKGSVAESNQCLQGTDAVVCIELIEHVYPDVLEEIPQNIFGFIQPSLAIFTTPNVEFNSLFPDPTRFRHDDHKFEWTRDQFECWATNITIRYPAYTVSFQAIGPPPVGYENLGPVSQMAIFTRIHQEYVIKILEDNTENMQKLNLEIKSVDTNENLAILDYKQNSYTDNFLSSELKVNYELIYDYNYPIKIDNRTESEKMSDEVEYVLSKFKSAEPDKYEVYRSQDDEYLRVPVQDVLDCVKQRTLTPEELEKLLADMGYTVTEEHQLIVDNFTNYKDRNYHHKSFDDDYYQDDYPANNVYDATNDVTECWD